MSAISPSQATITVEDHCSAPETVLVAFARFHAYPVTIGLAATDGKPSDDASTSRICRLDIGSRAQDCAGVIAEWQRDWTKTRFIPPASSEFSEKLPDRNLAETALHLWLTGTPFQHAVWRILLSIPCGSTMTYGEIAERLGKPKASRAVGMACGANPIPLLVPCHRAVAANGGLGGYSGRGGCSFKLQLLEQEALAA